MPKAAFFAWGQNQPREILCLPRGSSSPSVGCYVALRNGDWPGPMSPGDYAITVEDTGAADTPFLVQELVSGRLWYYSEAALQRVPEDVVPHDLRHPSHPGEGSYVTLVHDYKRFSDAGRGPLSLMRTEDAYGLVLMESGQRFRVRSCHTRKDWWYDHGAVRPVHMKYVPEALRAAVRPTWGDYVALTHDHSSFGTAADGPLEPGNLGVVVAVTECADSQGGLLQTRYCVRSCHNGQSYRYQEGALHLVVQQLLHAPKIPPSTGRGRRRKLDCQLHITQAGSGSHVPTGQVLTRGSIQQVQLVQPGKKYWIAAQLSSKDDDLMLANFKPTAWDLYAPSGRPGHYLHLKPVPCSQQQRWQQQQLSGSPEFAQQQQGQQLLSLAYCNGAAAAGSAAAGSCAWYNAQDDVLFGVFEWDSAETPITHKLGRVTEVSFVWGVCFKSVSGQFTKQQVLHVQTAQQSSSTSTSSTFAGAAAAARQHSSVTVPAAAADGRGGGSYTAAAGHGYDTDTSSRSVVFEWLDVPANKTSSSYRNRRSSNSSSSTSDGDDDHASDPDDGNDSDSSSETSAEEEETADTENAAAGAADTDRDRRDSSGNNDGAATDGQGSNSRIGGGGNHSSGNDRRDHGGSGGSGSNGSGGEDGSHTAPPTPPAGATGSTAADAAAAAGADVAHARLAAAAAAGFAVGLSRSASSMSAAEAALAGFGTGLGCGDTGGDGSSSSSGTRCPSTPELPDADTATRYETASAESATVGSSMSAQQLARPARSSSSVGRSCDCEHDRSRRDQQQQQLSRGGPSSGSSISRGGSTSRAADACDTGQDSGTAAAAAEGSHGLLRSSAAAAVLGGGVHIGEIMRQVERQAESNEPCWQEGNEQAAALAAAAMAAAEDFLPGNWCRPRFQRQQQQQRDQQQHQ